MKKFFGVAAFCVLLFSGTTAAQEFGPWSAPVSLGPTVNSACDDQHPTLSKDGLSLIFGSTRPQNPTQTSCDIALHLWVSQRDSLDSPWQKPQPLTMLNSPDNSPFLEYSAYFTTDGHWLFFHSSRNDGSCNGGGRLELLAAHRQDKRNDFGWETPINLGCTLNTSGADNAGPTFWEDDTTGTLYLYFTRNNTPTNPNGYNIYVSTCTTDLDSCNRQQLWNPGAYIAELNSQGFRNTRTAIRRRDGLEMLITSNRPGTVGNLDLWVSTRGSAQDPWSLAIDLNTDNINKGGAPAVNSTANDGAPALSWDGQTMIFYSNKAGGLGGNDLYVSTRQSQPVP
jgi:WD40-like Beta Propeller Repeat